jgi:hypothetical protein
MFSGLCAYGGQELVSKARRSSSLFRMLISNKIFASAVVPEYDPSLDKQISEHLLN